MIDDLLVVIMVLETWPEMGKPWYKYNSVYNKQEYFAAF